MSTGKLAARVAALENEVARLRRDLEGERDGVKPWWEHIAGTFAQDRLYKEAMKLVPCLINSLAGQAASNS